MRRQPFVFSMPCYASHAIVVIGFQHWQVYMSMLQEHIHIIYYLFCFTMSIMTLYTYEYLFAAMTLLRLLI